MESLKAPSPTALAAGALVVIWTEAARKRVSFWVAVQDTMGVMERRRVAVAAQNAHEGVAASAPEPEPEPDYSEPRGAYERMRGAGRKPFFRDSDAPF